MKQPHNTVPIRRSSGAGAERLGREQTRKPNPSPREHLGTADPMPASPSAAAALSIPPSQIHPRSTAGTEGSGCGAATMGTIFCLGSTKELGLCPFLPPTSPKRRIGEVETRLLSEHGSAPLHGRKLSAKPVPAPATEQSSASLPRSGTTRLGFAAPTPPLCRDAGPQGQHRVAGCPGKRRATYGHRRRQNRPWSRAFPPPILTHSPGAGQEWVV